MTGFIYLILSRWATTFDGKQMDSRLLDIALQALEGASDGRISQHDAEKLFEVVKDGNRYTQAEKITIAYIREHFKWADSADNWFRTRFHIGVRLPVL